jgi:hypothetical protein
MGVVGNILAVVLGATLVAVPWLPADYFKFRGQTGAWTKACGMADNDVSALTRWITFVVTGLVFVTAAIGDLASH